MRWSIDMKAHRIGSWVKNLLILLFSIIYLVPLYIAIVNSVKPYSEILLSPLSLPKNITFDNFVDAFNSSNILGLYKTSIIITVSSVALE